MFLSHALGIQIFLINAVMTCIGHFDSNNTFNLCDPVLSKLSLKSRVTKIFIFTKIFNFYFRIYFVLHYLILKKAVTYRLSSRGRGFETGLATLSFSLFTCDIHFEIYHDLFGEEKHCNEICLLKHGRRYTTFRKRVKFPTSIMPSWGL